VNNGKVDWHGSFCAVVTPFKADGEIDEERFRGNLERLIAEGLDGVVVSGCTGESWSLAPEERLRLFRLAVDTAAGRVPIVGGTGGIDTVRVAELSRAAVQEAGCAGVMILPPYYAVPNPREILAHFRFISDRARTPILLYNIPKRTGINLSMASLDELVDLEWIVAMKQSSNDFVELERTLATVGDRITVLAGHSAERGVPAVLMGCPGFVSSMESQIMGAEAISMYRLATAGQIEEAKAVQMRTLKLDQGMREIGTFPANLKCAMNLLGRGGGHARAPLLDLDAGETARVEALLDSLGLLSSPAAVA
jgi:4-hydroxy-tetrahydrodipicolinate synthase